MKSVFHISILVILIGAVTTVPISRHLCEKMMAQTSMGQNDDHPCCEQESMPSDCCHDEIQYLTYNNNLNISFSGVESGNLSDYWINSITSNLNVDYDLYRFSKSYIRLSELSPKNETGLYKYVQSYLI